MNGLFKWLENRKFKEYFMEQRFSGKEIKSSENDTLELVKGNSKMWIIYQECKCKCTCKDCIQSKGCKCECGNCNCNTND